MSPRVRWTALALFMATSAFAPSGRTDDFADCNAALVRGQELRREGKLLEARAAYPTCLRASCDASLRAVCQNFLAQIEPRVPSLQVEVRDERGTFGEARVYIDGTLVSQTTTPVEVNPGEHVVRAEARGHLPKELHVVVGEGERARPVVLVLASALTASPSPGAEKTSGPPASVYVLGGVSLVALGSFAYFALRGKSTENDLRASCPAGPCDSTAMRRDYLAADISLGVSVVAAGAALWVALANGHDAAHLAIRPSAHGGGLAILGLF